MAWKEVSRIPAIDIKKKQGEKFEGTYLGHRDIETKIGKQVLYEFEDESGKFAIYGFTMLNRAMDAISEGTLCRIEYLGTQKVETKFGKKDVHQVRVEMFEDGEPKPL